MKKRFFLLKLFWHEKKAEKAKIEKCSSPPCLRYVTFWYTQVQVHSKHKTLPEAGLEVSSSGLDRDKGILVPHLVQQRPCSPVAVNLTVHKPSYSRESYFLVPLRKEKKKTEKTLLICSERSGSETPARGSTVPNDIPNTQMNQTWKLKSPQVTLLWPFQNIPN